MRLDVLSFGEALADPTFCNSGATSLFSFAEATKVLFAGVAGSFALALLV